MCTYEENISFYFNSSINGSLVFATDLEGEKISQETLYDASTYEHLEDYKDQIPEHEKDNYLY
ncbi:MAG: hypothetical protein FWC47_00625 [Oscillospiraceae bacterium]|nr:hypothetical protein [Oscillospiraceae bacterium]